MVDLGWASRELLRALVQSLGIGDDRVDRFCNCGEVRMGSTEQLMISTAACIGARERGTLLDHYAGVPTALGLNRIQQIPGLTIPRI